MAASTKKRELNDMNAIACLLVILIHVLSIGISSVTPTSWQGAVIYFPWRLAAFVVPMFLYTGAIKMALHFMDTEVTFGGYLRYMLQRGKTRSLFVVAEALHRPDTGMPSPRRSNGRHWPQRCSGPARSIITLPPTCGRA